MRIIFACGGTAGHINPALAVAGRIKELMPDSEFLFIGAVGQMESDLVPRAGYKIETVRVRGLSREKTLGGFFHNISAAWHLVRSTIKARKIIKRFKPDVVVGTGGYVCFPVLKAASMLGIPTAVHESNADPGLTTRMLSGIVDTIMLGFEESRKFYKNPEKTVVTGTPVRGEFSAYSKQAAKAELGLPLDKPLVVSVWGSLGAENMNEVMCRFIELAGKKPGFTLIHSAGVEGYEKMVEHLRRTVPDYEKTVWTCVSIYMTCRALWRRLILSCAAPELQPYPSLHICTSPRYLFRLRLSRIITSSKTQRSLRMPAER